MFNCVCDTCSFSFVLVVLIFYPNVEKSKVIDLLDKVSYFNQIFLLLILLYALSCLDFLDNLDN